MTYAEVFFCYNQHMTKSANPFERHGYDPSLMDLATQALKRGRGGEGVATYANIAETLIELDEDDKRTIAHMIDQANGPECGKTVGYGIVAMLVLKAAQHKEVA